MSLETKLSDFSRLNSLQEKALKKLGLETVEDLLYHFPAHYADTADIKDIRNLEKGEKAVVFGKLSKLKTAKAFRKKIPLSEAYLEDGTGRVKIVWFHQAYLAKMLEEGAQVRVEGKVSERNGDIYFSNPKVESAPTLFAQGRANILYPVYPETRGISSDWLYHKIQSIFSSGILEQLTDLLPGEILRAYSLPNLKTSLVWIHSPQRKEHADAARKRFAFQEIFLIQIERQKAKLDFQKKGAFLIEKSSANIEKFMERFPFKATQAQERAISQILTDFKKGHPMTRLLEGDVGSGKTAVAATAAYAVATSKPKGQNFGTLQVAYMAPTEILAQQHFESFIKLFNHLPINIALITGTGIRKFPSKVNPDGWTSISRSQLLKWVANGEISIVIGTHALIQKSVRFKHLALAIIDEQHRFGTAQRQKLAGKEELAPHLLSMTATPIPRTLALTLYGNLDLTLLDQMPAGRKKIITEIIEPKERAGVYQKIRKELEAGRQMYVICPRIDEPDPDKEAAVQAKSVKEEAKRLKKEVFQDYEIEILHSKMKPAEKESIMLDFKDGKIDILVSTSVVEVGVNVENASLIIIEGAERFGLAQLHQLRGRVLRGTHQPYCFIFAETKSEKTLDRLEAIKTARNGFELAEFDLLQRGAGELVGTKQWGISDLGMEAIKNLKMVEAARTEAQKIIEEDPELNSYPLLKERMAKAEKKIHFE
jgi:ATP-dependent DNA helicase RecG